jgi:hypothetical protein
MDSFEIPQEGSGSAAPLSDQEMLGPPPLIRGEDIDRYDKLLARLTETLQPADTLWRKSGRAILPISYGRCFACAA